MATKPTYPVNLPTHYVPPAREHGPRMVPVPYDETHYIVDPSAHAVGAGIPDAPADGNLYGRQDTDWTQIVFPPPPAVGTDAPSDGTLYGRQNASWLRIPSPPPPAIGTDAPTDGVLYTRANGNWVRVPSIAATPQATYIVRTDGSLWILPSGGAWSNLPTPASGNARIIQLAAYELPGNVDVLLATCTQGAGLTWVYYTMQVQVPYTWTVLPLPP